MEDLSNALAVESASLESIRTDRAKRAAAIVILPGNTPTEKSIKRQMSLANDHKEIAENILMTVGKIVVPGAAAAPNITADTKNNLMQMCRRIIVSAESSFKMTRIAASDGMKIFYSI